MELDTAANPAGGEDTSALETQSPSTVAPEATAPAGGATEATAEGAPGLDLSDLVPPEDELAEVDYEGAKYKVPAPLKEAFLRQSDYTRKTTEIAEQRSALEAQNRAIQQAQQMSAAEIRTVAQLDSLSSQIAEFNGIEWAALDGTDPEVQQAKWAYQQLVEKKTGLEAQLSQHFQAKTQSAQREAAKAREESEAVMAKEIKDWSPEKRKSLEQLAVNLGVPQDVVGQASAPELRILNFAHIGMQFIERQRAAARAATSNAVKSAHEVGGGTGSGTSDPSAMSMEQYREWRAKNP